jgi:DNA-directed RNA polymerase subunit E'/Rpb7
MQWLKNVSRLKKSLILEVINNQIEDACAGSATFIIIIMNLKEIEY